MGNMSGSYGSHYTLWQTITENSKNNSNNSSNVTVKMYLSFDGSSYYAYTNYTTSGSMVINGTTHNYSINPISFSSGQAKDLLLAQWTGDIAHNSDGSKTLNVSGSWNTDTTRIGSGSCSTSKVLSSIQRYANLTSLSVKSKTINSITLQYTTDRAAWLFVNLNDAADFLNGGEPFVSNTTSGSFTIYYKDRANTKRLDPNVLYKIKVLCRADGRNGTLDTTKTITASTYDIAKISSVNNFSHGDNANVSITNPSRNEYKFSIEGRRYTDIK